MVRNLKTDRKNACVYVCVCVANGEDEVVTGMTMYIYVIRVFNFVMTIYDIVIPRFIKTDEVLGECITRYDNHSDCHAEFN